MSPFNKKAPNTHVFKFLFPHLIYLLKRIRNLDIVGEVCQKRCNLTFQNTRAIPDSSFLLVTVSQDVSSLSIPIFFLPCFSPWWPWTLIPQWTYQSEQQKDTRPKSCTKNYWQLKKMGAEELIFPREKHTNCFYKDTYK